MPDVFISYKRERRAAAEHVAEILRRYGYDVWFDYALVKGRDFGFQIDKAIRASKTLLVLWCRRSVGSRWVQEEVDLAHELGILIPVKIEPCELPVGNRRVDHLDLSSWDGAPRSPMLDDLLIEVGERVGRPPAPDFLGLRGYELVWRRFGAPPLTAFALSPSAPAVGTSPATITDVKDLSILREIWEELKDSESADRLERFLQQVRDTPFEAAVEERIAAIESAAISTTTAQWLRDARPLLERIRVLYESMGWSQAGPEPDAARFAHSLRSLIESMAAVPEGADAIRASNAFDEYLNTKLHHGLPIPDDFTLEAVFPLPGSRWGASLERVRICRRPGLKSSRYVREGFGQLPEGLIVEPEIEFRA